MTYDDPGAGDRGDEIRLTLPAEVSYARVARLAMTGLASRFGFTYDEVEDIRIAIGEVYSLLLDGTPDDRICITCRFGDDEMHMEATRLPTRPLQTVTDLSRQILAAVVDHAEIDEQAGRITMSKVAGDQQ